MRANHLISVVLFFLCIEFTSLSCQTLWTEQLIFKTNLYEKQGEMRGYVLLYAPEHKKLIALDAENGAPVDTKYNLEGDEIFLNVPPDEFIHKQVLFIGRKKENRWQLEIYHFTGQTIIPTGPPFVMSQETRRILELVYRNGYLYYLYETNNEQMVLERKHIQCTSIGLPTFSNEKEEEFYNSAVDKFLIEPRFTILPDGLDAGRDIVMIVSKGNAPGVVSARVLPEGHLSTHSIVQLPDVNVSLAPPRGYSFPTVIVQGSRQNGYDLCLIGHLRDQLKIYFRKMGKNDEEVDELELIPATGGSLYCSPFWIKGNWWFPLKKEEGTDLVYYAEYEGGRQISSNFFNVLELHLIADPRDSHFLYGLAPGSWRKYALGHSLTDWRIYGGFRSVQFGKKNLCPLPSSTAAGYKLLNSEEYQPVQIIGHPYSYSSSGLEAIEQLQIKESAAKNISYLYLTTKESSPEFMVTRKYCLLYNPGYSSSSLPKDKEHYEYHLCWEASYGSDKNILGFYFPYRGKNILWIKAVNQLYQIDCSSEVRQRIAPFSFGKISVPEGIQEIAWYQKDLQNIKKIEYLGKFREQDHYVMVTTSNIYQVLIDPQENFTLIPGTVVTGPLKEVSYCTLSEDGSTVICGGLTELNRTFLAHLYILPGNEKKLPGFSGITSQYVQNIREQDIRRPKKMLNWGENVYILTYKGEVEYYEKTSGSFMPGGQIQLPGQPILDMELLGNHLCLLTSGKLYSLDLRGRNIGTSLQTHFHQNKMESDWNFESSPIMMEKHNHLLFVHFPQKLECIPLSEGRPVQHHTLVSSPDIVPSGFQTILHKETVYIAGNKRLYKYPLRPAMNKPLEPWLTLKTNICRIFISGDGKELYYLSQDGEVGAVLTQE